jgi:peptidoglycan/xylan/chitin deacetylase (PgdA/CDA1 family)
MTVQTHTSTKLSISKTGTVLAYHEVIPFHSLYVYRVSVAQFQEHVSFFGSSGTGSNLGLPLAGITFDDGHRSNFECAYPALEQAGLKATFFILSGCVGNLPEYLTWSQVREMSAAGHHIQSHGWSHRMLTHCSPYQLQEELVRSKQELEDRLGDAVTSLSLPGGRWNEVVIAACAKAGYTSVFHSNPWAKTTILHGVCVRGRFTVTNCMDAQFLRAQMQLGSLPRLYFGMRYATKDGVRAIIGDRLYHRLWRRFVRFDSTNGMEVHVGEDAGEAGSAVN